MNDRSLPGIHDEPATPLPRWRILIFVLVVLAAVAAVIFASVTTNADRHRTPSADPADSAPSAYEQTWHLSYTETTCSDWKGAMTEQQRFAAAADILAAAWGKIEGSSKFPGDSLIAEFRDGIGNVCVIPTMNVAEASYGLYSTEPRFKP